MVRRGLPSFFGTTIIREHQTVGVPWATGSLVPMLTSRSMWFLVMWDRNWGVECLRYGVLGEINIQRSSSHEREGLMFARLECAGAIALQQPLLQLLAIAASWREWYVG